MKTTFATLVVVLSFTVLPGCGDKSTPGGDTGKKPPMVGEADNTFKLTVPGNVPYETAVKQGGSTPFKIGISRGKNFDGDVSLKFEGLPAGVTVEPAGAAIKHDAAEANLTLKAADDAATGSATIKVTGTPTKGAAAVNEFKINVTGKAPAPNYSVTLPSTTIKQGETKDVTISVKRDKGFEEDVTFKFEALPPGLTVEPAAPTVKNGEKDTKVIVKAAGDAALGEKTIKVIANPTKSAAAQLDMKVTVDKK